MIDIEAIRKRNEAWKQTYKLVAQTTEDTVMADIDALLAEVDRLRAALHALNPRSSTIYGSQPDNPYEYGVDTLTPEEE